MLSMGSDTSGTLFLSTGSKGISGKTIRNIVGYSTLVFFIFCISFLFFLVQCHLKRKERQSLRSRVSSLSLWNWRPRVNTRNLGRGIESPPILGVNIRELLPMSIDILSDHEIPPKNGGLGDAKETPLSKIKQDFMAVRVYIEIKSRKKDQLCPICCTDFENNEEVYQTVMCHHVFHRFCMSEWLKKKLTCPYCGQEFSYSQLTVETRRSLDSIDDQEEKNEKIKTDPSEIKEFTERNRLKTDDN